MIGLILVGLAVFVFMVIGAIIVMGNLFVLLMVLSIFSFLAVGLLIMVGALWEWYFPTPAKTLISHKRGAGSFALNVDDIGWGELLASKSFLPEGLIKYKLGWSTLPRPIRKFVEELKIGKRPGREPKDPEEAKKRQKEWEKAQKLKAERENCEQELAEQIALKKITLKDMGKPLWLLYSGAAMNFNPYVLVPGEAKQDNPTVYFEQFTSFLEGLSEKLSPETLKSIKENLRELEKKCENIRVVLDPRRFKEVLPKMYTQSQIDAHGRVHERIGELKVRGMPMGKILTILLIGALVVGGIFVAYYFFMSPQSQPAQLVSSFSARLSNVSLFSFL